MNRSAMESHVKNYSLYRDLIIEYLVCECDNPAPTEADILAQMDYGVEVFGSHQKTYESLRRHFGFS